MARPPIPIYGIALLVAAAIALVAAVLGSAIVVFKKNINRKKKLRAYDVSKSESDLFSVIVVMAAVMYMGG